MHHLFTREGRQALVYLVFAGAGPALSAIVVWAMIVAQQRGQWELFVLLAKANAAGQFVVVLALSAFVSIRALKISAGGIEMDSREGEK
jgi:NAD/NADP transhydrogenase alpha subunit